MIHENGNSYRKTLIVILAGGAVAGGGFLAYRWWSRRSTTCAPAKPLPKDIKVESSNEDLKVQQPSTNEPSTEKFEMRVPSIVKEKIDVTTMLSAAPPPQPDVVSGSTNDLSTSSTFEKIPAATSSVSPEPEPMDSFVQLSMSSYQDDVMLQPRPPMTASSRTADMLPPPSEAAESSIELLSESSISFVAVPSLETQLCDQEHQFAPDVTAEQGAPEGNLLAGDSEEKSSADHILTKDSNDIVLVEKTTTASNPALDGSGEGGTRNVSAMLESVDETPVKASAVVLERSEEVETETACDAAVDVDLTVADANTSDIVPPADDDDGEEFAEDTVEYDFSADTSGASDMAVGSHDRAEE